MAISAAVPPMFSILSAAPGGEVRPVATALTESQANAVVSSFVSQGASPDEFMIAPMTRSLDVPTAGFSATNKVVPGALGWATSSASDASVGSSSAGGGGTGGSVGSASPNGSIGPGPSPSGGGSVGGGS